MIAGETAETDIFMNTSTEDCLLNAWVDFNANGNWDDPGEQIASDAYLAAGANYWFGFDVPATAELETITYARFRCSTESVGSYGEAPDGEIEDWEVMVFDGPVDFGDLPNLYGTLFSNAGAYHRLVGGFHLGYVADAEPNGKPSVDSTGDDLCGLLGDDEDGVTFLNDLVKLEQACVQVFLTLDHGWGGLLEAWVDFDAHGWGSGDQVFNGVPLVAGLNGPLCFMVPDTLASDVPIYSRFRVIAASGGLTASAPMGVTQLGPTGSADNGEVENYVWGDPTAITLADLEASGGFGLPIGLAVAALAGLVLVAAVWLLYRRRTA